MNDDFLLFTNSITWFSRFCSSKISILISLKVFFKCSIFLKISNVINSLSRACVTSTHMSAKIWFCFLKIWRTFLTSRFSIFKVNFETSISRLRVQNNIMFDQHKYIKYNIESCKLNDIEQNRTLSKLSSWVNDIVDKLIDVVAITILLVEKTRQRQMSEHWL